MLAGAGWREDAAPRGKACIEQGNSAAEVAAMAEAEAEAGAQDMRRPRPRS